MTRVLQLWSVLDECALQRLVGGAEVLRAQLDHLRKMAERTNIEIQVLPNSAGAHAGIEGPFTILDYPAEFEGDPGTVYVETRVRGIYYETPARGHRLPPGVRALADTGPPS